MMLYVIPVLRENIGKRLAAAAESGGTDSGNDPEAVS